MDVQCSVDPGTPPRESGRRREPGPGDDLAPELARALATGTSCAVVGGPGTGKTDLVRRVHAALAGLVPADEVLVLAPDRDHANELRDSLSAGDRAGVRRSPAARSLHSFAFGLVSAFRAAEFGESTRFVSGADQDALLAELLDGYDHAAERGITPPTWTERLSPEVRATAEFRSQLRDVLDRLLERDATPARVRELGRRYRGEWIVAAEILQDYQDLLDVPGFGGVDTASVLARAAGIVRAQRVDSSVRAGTRWSFSGDLVPRVLLVDAAQDVPDAAVPLLVALRDLGTVIGVLGSPDTGTQAFRGATGAVLRAAWTPDPPFAGPTGHRIEVLPAVGDDSRVQGTGAAVAQDFARRVSRLKWRDHLAAEVPMTARSTTVECLTAPSGAERARAIARLLRHWHHDLGLDWADCAVVARSSGTANGLRQELGSLGVPVDATVLPLAVDPATAPLLRALVVRTEDEEHHRSLVATLLTGVYVGLDPLAMRSLERALLAVDPSLAEVPGPSRPVHALRTWEEDALPPELRRVKALLDAAAEVRLHDPHSALWHLWETAAVADHWERRATGNPVDPLNDRIDAVLRLMSLAEKFASRGTNNAESFAALVLDQDVAQDSLARTGARDVVVVESPAALAHREFRHVVIADVDEGRWPNPRVRGTIFALEDLVDALEGRTPAFGDPRVHQARRRAVIEDEAMLFLSALTRAREHAVVVALDDGENSPSIFFHTVQGAARELGPRYASPTSAGDGDATVTDGSAEDADHPSAAGTGAHDGEPEGPLSRRRVRGGPRYPISLREIAGRARSEFGAAEDPVHWADLLVALERAGVAEADPITWSRWWEVSSTEPVHGPEDVVPVNPSAVETFTECSLKWFLTTHGGRSTASQAQAVGTLVHAIAEHHPNGGYAAMKEEFDRGFEAIEFASDWEKEREYAAGTRMIGALDAYIRSRTEDGAELLGAEATVSTRVDDPAVAGPWRITGKMDRLERTSAGLRVVDYKTGKNPVTKDEAKQHAQLGTYQVALEAGGAILADDTRVPAGPAAGGELVFLRRNVLREQPALGVAENPRWALELVSSTARGMRSSVFSATPSPQACAFCPVKTSCPAFALAPTEGAEG